jgi:hypothetical protein
MCSLYNFAGIINVYVCAFGKYFSSEGIGIAKSKKFSGKDAKGLKEFI